jgi:hypothetical protein
MKHIRCDLPCGVPMLFFPRKTRHLRRREDFGIAQASMWSSAVVLNLNPKTKNDDT